MKPDGYNLYPLGGAVLKGGRPNPANPINSVSRLIFSAVTPSTAIENTNAETDFDVFPTFPANMLDVQGAVVTVECGGVYATTGTPTMELRARLTGGGTVIGDGGVITLPNNAPAWAWSFRWGFTVLTTGATGSLQPHAAMAMFANQTTGVAIVGSVKLGVGSPIDMTISRSPTVTATWSAASLSNSISMNYMTARVEYALNVA